jgi:hypothetical protein
VLEKWIQVYYTSEMDKYFLAKNLMQEQNIKYKTNIFNNNLRLAMNSFGGKTSAGLSRSGNIKDFYTISVKKSDEHNARLLLSKIEG